MMNKWYILGIITVGLFLASVLTVSAIEPFPHVFVGNVYTNGYPAADNILVEAKFVGDTKPIEAEFTKDGSYGHKPDLFIVRDLDGTKNGSMLEFYVGGVKAAEHVFNNNGYTELDLTVTGDFPNPNSPPSNPPISGGGSNGGGGGGGSGDSGDDGSSDNDSDQTQDNLAATETITDAICTPEWICSEWLDCINGQQKRVCVDKNECETEDNKPNLIQDCETNTEVQKQLESSPDPENQGFFAGITGAVLGGGTGGIITLIVVLVILAAAVLFAFRHRIFKKK